MKSKYSTKKLREKTAINISETENIRKLIAKDAMIKPVLVYQEDGSKKIIKKLRREDINVCIVFAVDTTFSISIGA